MNDSRHRLNRRINVLARKHPTWPKKKVLGVARQSEIQRAQNAIKPREKTPWSTGSDIYAGGLHCIQLAVGFPPINVDEQAIEIKANQSGIDALEGNDLEVPVEYDDQCADEGVPVYRVMV